MSYPLAEAFSQIFNREELKELYGDNWNEVRKVLYKDNKGSATKVNSTSKPKPGIKKVPLNKTQSSTLSIPKSKPSASAFPRKKLFNVEPVEKTKTGAIPKIKQGNKRKSTSLLNMNDVENVTNLKQIEIKIHKTETINGTRREFNSLSPFSDRTNGMNGGLKPVKIEKSALVKSKVKDKDDYRIRMESILSNNHHEYAALKTKFDSLVKDFDDYSVTLNEKIKTVNELGNEFYSIGDGIQTSTKKKVAFAEDDLVYKIDIPEDPKFENALNMYNSYRKRYNVLSTPQLNRSNLQTPKSSRKPDGLSRKLQKQCLMLLDTPMK